MKYVAVSIAVLVAALLAFLVRDGSAGSWDAAHMAAAQALAETGTLAIDDTQEAFTAHRAHVGDHWYATSPPVPSLLAAVVLRLVDSRRVATFVVAALPAVLALLALAALVRPRAASISTTALVAAILSTPLLGFGTVLTGMALAVAGTASGLVARCHRRAWLAGLCMGVAASAVPIAAVMLVLFVPRRGALRYLAGAALPLAIHVSMVWGAAGSPFGFADDALHYGLAFHDLAALVRGADPFDGSALDTWIGPRGFVARFPIALVGLFGLYRGLRWRAPLAMPATIAAVVLLVVGSLPAVPATGMLAQAHVLLLPLLFFGASHLAPQSRGSAVIGGCVLLALSLPGAVWALRSPLFVWHMSPSQVPSARLGLHVSTGEAQLWRAEWDLAAVDRPTGRERLATEFGARVELVSRGVLEGEGHDQRDFEALRRGLVTIADRLDRERSPVYARPLVHYWLGRAHRACGDAAQAEESWRMCLSLYPSFAAARLALAEQSQRNEGQ